MKLLSDIWANIRKRRKSLGFNQKDMLMKIGMDQRQYQRLEKGSDTRVSTLLRILEGLDTEVVLVPKERLAAVNQLLSSGPDQFEVLENEIMDSRSVVVQVPTAELLWDELLGIDKDNQYTDVLNELFKKEKGNK